LAGHMPWLAVFRGDVSGPIFLTTFLGGLLVSFFLWRRSIARAGLAELDERGVVLTRGGRNAFVPWSDVDGYRDGDSDFVELARRAHRGASRPLRGLQAAPAPRAPGRSLEFSADGARLLSVSREERRFLVWEVGNPLDRRWGARISGVAYRAALAPSGNVVVVA